MLARNIGSLVKIRESYPVVLMEFHRVHRDYGIGIVFGVKEVTYVFNSGRKKRIIYQVYWSKTEKVQTHYSCELEYA